MKFNISDIEEAHSFEDLSRSLLRSLSRLGFSFFIYISTDPARTDTDLLTNLPALHDGPSDLFDPFLDYCCESYEPTFTGADFLPDYPYLRDADVAFIQRAADAFGWHTGLGVPVRLRGSDRFGGFNFGSKLRRDAFVTRIEPHQGELRVLALLAHRRLEEIARADPSPTASFRQLLIGNDAPGAAALTNREAEILYLISRGFTTKEIAQLCTISPHTAAEYRKSLYRKLGVRNASAAVARAAEIGLG